MAEGCHFLYQARRPDGALVKGFGNAADAAHLVEKLRLTGNLELVWCRRQWRRKSLGSRQCMDFLFNLRHGLAAGVPLLELLHAQSAEKGEAAAVAARLASQVEAGSSLASAMADSGAFDSMTVALVDCGENVGAIVPVLDDLMASMRHSDELATQFKRGLIQPAVGLVAVLAVMLSMSIWVAPGLAGFLQSMGQPLPQHTQVLLQLLRAPLALWPLWLALAALLPVAWLLLRLSPGARRAADRLLLLLPWCGSLCLAASLARVTSALRLLYGAGMPLPEAVDKACNCTSNSYLLHVLQQVGKGMQEGLSLVAALKACGFMQPMLLRMLSAGENAGALDVALAQLCHVYTRDLREGTARASAMVAPAITRALGLLLAWSALAFIAPIYELLVELPV